MKILSLGSINLDKSYYVRHIAKAKETIESLSFSEAIGGKGLNQSIAMSHAGGEVWFAGYIGKSNADLCPAMEKEGLHLDYLKMIDAPTGHAIIQIDEEGQNCILIHAGANGKVSEEYIESVLKNFGEGDFLVLQNEIANVDYAICEARKVGMTIFLNPSPINTGKEISNIELVDYIILNEIEGAILTGKTDFDDILSSLQEKYKHTTIILTIGDRGVLCSSKRERYSHGCYRVQAVDTTAAGDTFTGFFIVALSKKKTLDEALKFASLASALCVSKQGAVPSIPTLEELRNFSQIAKLV